MVHSGDWVASPATSLGASSRDPHCGSSGHAKHIGRVGALAVALGVGMAITVSATPAFADSDGPTDSTVSGDVGSTSAGTNSGGRHRRSATGSRSSTAAPEPAAAGERRRSRTATPAAAQPAATDSGGGAAKAADPLPAPAPASSVLGNGRSRISAGSGDAGYDVPREVPRASTAAAQATAPLASSAFSAAAATDPGVPPSVGVARASSVKRPAVRSVFAGLLGGLDSQAPVDSPVSWAVLAAALGQIGHNRSRAGTARAVAYSSAAVTRTLVAGSPSVLAPNVKTGAVSGAAVFVNTAGGTLTYSAPATSTRGGTVTLNTSTGAFTYTPTQAMRQAAGLATTDTFTVTAGNGTLTAFQTITVPVDPGTPVAGTPWVGTAATWTGLVNGQAKSTDGSGRALTYSAPSTSAGGGTVSINSGTGEFVYTPTQAMRQSAGLNTTDTFTVSTSNGVRTTTQTLTVTVDPGLPVAGAPWLRATSASTGVVTGLAKFTDGSGRTLTYSAPTTSAGGGAVSINSGTGEFTYTPTLTQRRNAGANTTDTFTVTSGNGVRSTTQTVTVAVDPGTPVAGTPSVGTPSLSTGVVTGAARGTDSIGRTLTYSAPGTSAGGGTVSINSGTGAFTYTPTQTQRQNAGLSTTDTFTVTISNGARTVSQAVTVGVDPGTPTANPPTVGTPASWTGVVSGVARGTDSVGGPLTYSAPTTTAAGGTVSMNAATGEFTYTPTQAQRRNAGLNTTDTFTVTIGNGARTTTRDITVAVDPGTPASGTPWVRTPNAATGEVTGTAKFTEPLNRTLTYSAPTTSTGGATVSINAATGDFTYTPTLAMRQAAGANTTDSFTVTAGNGVRTATQTVTVTVDPGTPVAGTPTVGTASLNTGVVTGAARATDSIGRTLSYSTSGTSTGGGTVTVNSGTGAFNYTPSQAQRQNAALNTTDTFTVDISNGARTIAQTVTVGVDPGTPVAGTPTVADPNVRTGVVTGSTGATDSVGGGLIFSTAARSTGGGAVSIDPGTGQFTYTPTQSQRQSAGLNTTDSFTVTVSNGARIITQSVTVAVDPGSPVASAPSLGSPYLWTGVINGAARFSDGSGRTLTYSTPATTAGGGAVSINAGTGAFTYTPTLSQRQNAGLSTTDSFTVTVTNGLRSSTQTVTVAVDPGTPMANTPWVRTPNSTTGVVTGIAKFVEPVGRTLTYSAPSTSAGGGTVSIDSSTGNFVYTPTQALRANAGQTPNDTITVTASNGLRTTTQTISVPIDPNSAPVLSNLSLTYGDGGVVDGTVSVTDADSDPVSVAVDTPTHGALSNFNSTTGAFTFTPTTEERHTAAAGTSSSDQRTARFTLTASDGRGGVTPYEVNVTITPLNSDPTGTYTFGAPSEVTGQASGSLTYTDADNDTLAYSVAAGPTKGSVVFDQSGNGTFTYTPTWQARHYAAADGVGPQSDAFTLAVDDGHGGRVTIPLTVDIVKFNTALADSATVGPSEPYNASMVVSVYDADGDVPTYTVVTGPGKGTLSINGGYVLYTPDRAISHPIAAGAPPQDDAFTLTVDDGHGSRVTMDVNLTIGPANYIPTFETLTYDTPDSQTGVVTGSLTAVDPVDDDVRTYSITRDPVNGGTVTIDPATGAFTYTPSADARQDAATVQTSVGVFTGRWSRYQVSGVQRRYSGCAQSGDLCEVTGFSEPYIDTGYGWQWWNQPSWSTGDYVQLVDTGRDLWGSLPDVALVQYSANGVQKQVLSSSGYVESLGSGIVYNGSSGYNSYYISNALGIGRNSLGSYSYVVDRTYPGRTQLNNYLSTTTLLDSGEVLANTDIFTISVDDGHGGITATTISVPILPVQS